MVAMSHKLTCIMDGCDASITEATEEEVLEAAEAHAAEAHPDLELDEETVETVRAHIEEV